MIQDKLLDTAIREFGAKGLDGASTRGIAAAAGTAMSSITYHYGGKEGLYLAAARHVARGMAEDMAPLADAGAALDAEDPAAARMTVHRILGHFADKMASERSAEPALFIMREQMHPSPAFDLIYGGVMETMLRTLADLVCVATQARDRRAGQIAAMTLVGQVVGLRASRAMWLRLIERDAIGGADLSEIKARIAANVDAILDRLIAEQQGLS